MSKKINLIVLSVIVIFGAFYFYNKYRVAPKVNFPVLPLTDLNGTTVNFSDFKGKKLIVSFGASWCPNCIDELNTLKKINDSKLSGIEVVVISDEPIEKVTGFKERREYPFTFLKMSKSFSEIGINSIPTTYIVNTKLEVVKEQVGYIDWEDESTLNHLKTIME